MRRSVRIVAIVLAGLGGAVTAGLSASRGSSAASPVPAVLTCSGKTVVRPKSYVLACADANAYFNSMRWTSWGRTSAAATASFVQNNCAPTCADGKFITYPARIVLSRPRSTKLGLLFSTIRYSYTVSASTTLPLTRLSEVR